MKSGTFCASVFENKSSLSIKTRYNYNRTQRDQNFCGIVSFTFKLQFKLFKDKFFCKVNEQFTFCI